MDLTHAELRRVRDERDRLKAKVQRSLGQRVDQSGNIELEKRIRELGEQLRQRDAAVAQVRAERDGLQTQTNEAQDIIAAHTTSLRQMMRDHSAER